MLHRLEDVAYAAGFVDGEGSIFISRRVARPAYHDLRLAVVNTKIAPLLLLKDLWEGYIYEIAAKGKRIRHWRWTTASKQARVALDEMLPFLRVKRDQARLALAFGETLQSKPYRVPLPPSLIAWRDYLRIRIKELNHA